jgi:thiamine-phosphate pyrophosphorylase
MDCRQPLPRRWLMTDERLGDRLFAAIGRLPDRAGIVFRHYSLEAAKRRALFEEVKRQIEGRGLTLLLAGPAEEAQLWGAAGSHGRGGGAAVRTAPARSLEEIRAAEAAGAALVFLSPVFATNSHPGRSALGTEGFDAIAARTRLPVVALGGMDESRFGLLKRAYGWAGIDAWTA